MVAPLSYALSLCSVRHDYDGQNRLIADIRILNGSDIRTSYAYDPAGNRISVTDPLNHTTETRYDEWNRPWQTIDADNYTVTTELDGEGNKTRIIDANNVTRTWTYDRRGLMTSRENPEVSGLQCGRARSRNLAGANPAPEGWPSTG